jgi:hypothetical protein
VEVTDDGKHSSLVDTATITVVKRLTAESRKRYFLSMANSSSKPVFLFMHIYVPSFLQKWKEYEMDNLNSSSPTNCPIFLFKLRHPSLLTHKKKLFVGLKHGPTL